MDIVLTKEEKRTFYGFLGLYLGLALFLISIIAWLFYYTSSKNQEELVISKMQINASKLASEIIQAHMKGLNLDLEKLKVDSGFEYGLFDKKKRAIYKEFKQDIDLTKNIIKQNNSLFFVDTGSSEHLAVSYVVIKENYLKEILKNLKNKIILITIIGYFATAFVGFYLAKLFIYPIQSQREKLNKFIKDTTHELNTPISAILLCTNSELNESNKEVIKLSAKKISNLYKDLTYITLKNNIKKEIKLLDISAVLKEELEFFNKLAKKKNISIESKIKQSLIKIDKEDFTRLINNLISNALKYTKRNGHIKISLSENELIIEDNGVGIEKEKLNKIHGRYYRANDEIGGFGIGLDIVNSIVKQYNIKLNIISEKNKGSKFILKF